ncbi:MAG: HEAT repeat domain-containing protein [Microbacterium sp.]|uniref:HEAT repeat domain-containing protein n=1 Tax=Microbacterium sp. TaxID=51671 RepID=UPI001AC3E399|nr:HEAT repeat domain-containing protein [Microbacterium sp.]MBN9176860.1 HEAT repeat domain-containing protein [Microbacterium sp.]
MVEITTDTPGNRLRTALRDTSASARLQAALAAGTRPDGSYIEVLVERCEVEPDFFVRDMLTWALTRHDPAMTVKAVLPELHSSSPQARSQALHTLSKIGDPATGNAITVDLLHDEDVEVARAAWRTAAGFVPQGGEVLLARELVGELGRGDRETQRSLSRAFAVLGATVESVIEDAARGENDDVSAHAVATLAIMADPDEGFDAAIAEAKRVVALRGAPAVREQ